MIDWNKPLRTKETKLQVELLAGPYKSQEMEHDDEHIWVSVMGSEPVTLKADYVENIPEPRYLTGPEMIQLAKEGRLLKRRGFKEVHQVTGYREREDGTVCVFLDRGPWSAEGLYKKWTDLDGSNIESNGV